MNLSLRSTKLASIFALVTAAFGLSASGCYVQAGVQGTRDDNTSIDSPAPSTTPAPSGSPSTSPAPSGSPSTSPDPQDPAPDAIPAVSVDPNATMTTYPGEGVGLYVEYEEGGHWYVYTTCDTAISGASCAFDVIVTPELGASLSSVEGMELEANDAIKLYDDGSIGLVTDTAYGMNGVAFDADPGALVEIDMLLDGVPQPALVYYVDRGVLTAGVPGNPVGFIPSSF